MSNGLTGVKARLACKHGDPACPKCVESGTTGAFCFVEKMPKVKDLADDFVALWHKLGQPVDGLMREYRFHAERKWRFDVAWPDAKVAVELEGALWVKSRHRTGKGYQADIEKYSTATADGWRVLRFSADDLRKRPLWVIELVSRTLSQS